MPQLPCPRARTISPLQKSRPDATDLNAAFRNGRHRRDARRRPPGRNPRPLGRRRGGRLLKP
eukprot:8098706-Pyramimonas_sp.AAC.1